jgi:hypothetical protein
MKPDYDLKAAAEMIILIVNNLFLKASRQGSNRETAP